MADRPGHWQGRPLAELSREEWEGLCDGCARCCLVQLEDIDTAELHLTRVACRHLSLQSCRCQVYAERSQVQPDCVTLTPERLTQLEWMPESCAYRRLAEGRPLPKWHPLLHGNAKRVPRVCSYAVSEGELSDTDELETFIIDAHAS